MRYAHSFKALYAVRSTFAAGAVAGLVVLGACSDSPTSTNSITAPASPRSADGSSGTQGHGFGFAGRVEVCVDASSPAGTYTFTNSGWNSGMALGGGYDQGDGGEGLGASSDGTTVFNPPKGDGSAYTVAVGVGGCVTVLSRTEPSLHYDSPDPANGFPTATQTDDWQSVNVSVNTTPGGVVYDHTDCSTDLGTLPPQPSPCGNANSTTRAFANYDHGTRITFVFTGGGSTVTTNSCPDATLTAGFNGTAIPAPRTVWFVANLKPKGQVVGTVITFENKGINLDGTAIAGPGSIVTYAAAGTDATTTYNTVLNRWETVVPINWTQDVFLAGTQYAPPGGLPGGVSPVTWKAGFASSTPGVEIKWQWAASVYNGFGSYDVLGVKPIGGKTLLYPNADKQGTPENFKANIKSGAMGGGASNTVGSWSATKAVCVVQP